MSDARGSVCVIPAFNAARTLTAVLVGIRSAVPDIRIIVVDDGSHDATRDVAAAGADGVIALPVNRGKGAALRAGLRRALELRCAAVVTLDADGQHDPAAVPQLLGALECADLVIGSRRAGPPMPWRRRVTNRIASSAVSACTGRGIPDSQSGFRAFRASVVRAIAIGRDAERWGDGYEYETAVLIRAARRGCRLAFVPVPTVYSHDAVSHFRGVRDTVRVAHSIARGFLYST
jgi:glycosyltransferase involved in cell wall biosynthesis